MTLWKVTTILLCIPPFFSLVGCTNVEPWDRNILARDDMTLLPDPLDAEWKTHAQFSREGTEGATGISGGGCGCN